MAYDEEKTKKLMGELQKMCQPICDWLQTNYHPCTKVIIDVGYATLVEDLIGVPLEVMD